VLADVDLTPGAAERLLVRSDLGGTMQLLEWSGGSLRALTDLPEPVSGARYLKGPAFGARRPHNPASDTGRPRDPASGTGRHGDPSSDTGRHHHEPARRAVLEIDRGGDERHQLYLLDLQRAAAHGPIREVSELHALTDDPAHVHRLAGCSPDGTLIAYVSNRRDGVAFDLWCCEPASGEHRLLYAPGAWLAPGSGFSPDGRLVSVLAAGEDPLDVELVLVDVHSGRVQPVLSHPDRAALVGPPAWTGERTFCLSTDLDREFATVVRVDLTTGAARELAGLAEPHDTEVVASADGSAILTVANRRGESVVRLHAPDGEPITYVQLPEGAVARSHALPPPILSADGSVAYLTISTPQLAADVFAYDRRGGALRRLTRSPIGIDPATLAHPEHATTTSFDGLQLPLVVFRPPASAQSSGDREAGPPAVVLIHGGPESQFTFAFSAIAQGLALAGYAVVAPNVRGSTGYGRTYAALDDGRRRLDAVRDLKAVHRFVGQAGFDPRRVALWGASYGGYMVLAGLAFQPELWAAGVDIVGISDLVSFLEGTAAYRRAHREREYGSLAHDREFLRQASPLARVDAIRAPLMVIHGRNDPRVPVGEALQVAEALRRRDVPCELLIYDDEGHGLARLENRLDAYGRAVAFLDRTLTRA